MPELPDLEVYRRNLTPRVCGREITSVTFHREKRLNVTPETLASALQGATLTEILRPGKELLLAFSNGRNLSIHLMLKGQFAIAPNDADIKYKVLTLGLGTEEGLIVFDSLGWTILTLDPEPSPVPDALSDAMTFDYLRQQLKASGSMPLKQFLTEQSRLQGIGNAYADEILWAARIAPESRCDRLPDPAIEALYAAIRSVLTDAIEQITLIKPGILGGEVRDHLKIYSKKLCPNGRPIQSKEVATRKSYFTDEQKLYT